MVLNKTSTSIITLCTSLSTLICCALPAVLVLIGLGSTLASFIAIFPQIIWFSEHKVVVFLFAGFMITFSLVQMFFVPQQCPIDEVQKVACIKARNISKAVVLLSTLLYVIGAFFAFFVTWL